MSGYNSRRPWREQSAEAKARHVAAKRDRRAAKVAALVSRIRELAPNHSKTEIAGRLGLSWQRITALMERWEIEVRIPAAAPAPTPRLHRPEPAVEAPIITWNSVLQGKRYEDEPAACRAEQTWRGARPCAGSTGESSMAWAG